MVWRVAKSLEVLLKEINTAAPDRSKASDGAIGDKAHQDSDSDHNPNNSDVVCARDFTHDPSAGANMHEFAEYLRDQPHKTVKYIIWNKRIWSKARAGDGWRDYNGSNPHTKHMHVSVGVGSDGQSRQPYDDTAPWGIADIEQTPQQPATPKPNTPASNWTKDLIMALPTLKQGSKGADVGRLQGLLIANSYRDSGIDHKFGPKTAKALRRFQADKRVKNSVVNGRGDGVAGRYTWTVLLGE